MWIDQRRPQPCSVLADNTLKVREGGNALSLGHVQPMIQLTRLNNLGLLVNCDLIKFVETAPDTVLTLTSGEKIVVRERPEEVMEKIIQFKRLILEHGERGTKDEQSLAEES